MAYADTRRASPAGMVAAIGVQAAIGFAVITGLTVTAGIVEKPEILDTWDIKDEPPPPAPPPPEPATDAVPEVASTPPITVPQPDLSLSDIKPVIPTTELIVPPQPMPKPGPTKLDPVPSPTPSGFEPVGAKPRNDPGRWLSDRDYKSSWARRDLTGTATFKLDISATGNVTGCQVPRSTGHSELDAATCVLVQKRAKFEPARGRSGEPVAGRYTGSVLWQLPD